MNSIYLRLQKGLKANLWCICLALSIGQLPFGTILDVRGALVWFDHTPLSVVPLTLVTLNSLDLKHSTIALVRCPKNCQERRKLSWTPWKKLGSFECQIR